LDQFEVDEAGQTQPRPEGQGERKLERSQRQERPETEQKCQERCRSNQALIEAWRSGVDDGRS
jgi:hypothetical protein